METSSFCDLDEQLYSIVHIDRHGASSSGRQRPLDKPHDDEWKPAACDSHDTDSAHRFPLTANW